MKERILFKTKRFLSNQKRGWDKTILANENPNNLKLMTRSGNILRFPWAAGEPPRAVALWGLADAFAPTGVYVYLRSCCGALFVF
jgi:hypothetical protein